MQQLVIPAVVAGTKEIDVLDTHPTNPEELLAAKMGIPACDCDMWDRAWIATLDQCTARVLSMSDAELARALAWAHEHSCYYHPELCDLLRSCVAAAVARLTHPATLRLTV